MSSLVRRLQIRAMQKAGYVRTKFILVKGETGEVRKQPVTRGGIILNSEADPVGYSWPRFLPKSETPSEAAKRKPKKPPRGSRRGKPSKWRRAA